MHLQPNTLFHDRYYLLEMKGRGSFGEVWLAKDQQLDIDVAIKIYIALDSRGVEDFKTEYKTAFGLNHPNLLHALHFDIFEDRPYLVMPYCPSSALDCIGNVSESTLWRFLHDVASGLAYLHDMGIIHHDIKPDNILVDPDGNFLITDFGISVKFRSTLRRNSTRRIETGSRGSMPYMAPEMFDEKAEAVNATDIWALGVTMFELMTGELPFFGQGGSMQLNGAKVPEVSGNWSDDLKQVVRMCLGAEPWNRPTAKQLVSYAQNAIEGKSNFIKVNEERKDVDKKESEKSRKKSLTKWMIIVAIAAAFVAVAIGLMKKCHHVPVIEPVIETEEKKSNDTEEVLKINDEYAVSVTKCRALVSQGSSANPQDLIKAKEELAHIGDLELQYGNQLDSIVSKDINVVLLPKLKEAARAWADAAEAQVSIGEIDKALEFYQLSLDLYESQEISAAIQNIKMSAN